MKITKILMFLVFIYGVITSTRIETTNNEILFKPLGRLIPELSWATIRTKVNISDMFMETNQLCKAMKIMDKEYTRLGRKYAAGKRRIAIPPNKISDIKVHLIELLTHDIKQMCEENTRRIEEIIDVFSINYEVIHKPRHIPSTRSKKDSNLIRKARQLVVGTVVAAVGVLTSLVSIFTSKELLSMSSSQDTSDEIIDNNNNIIRSLQTHENAIHRNKETIKRVKENIAKLENYLSIEKRATDTYITLFAIKVFGSTTTQHLQRIQDGLYQLLKNKLSPKLVPLKQLQGVLGKIKDITRKRGYELAINSAADIYMCQTSFVAYTTGELIVLSHIPMYKTKHLMKLLEYQPTPIILSKQSDQQVFIQPNNPIIAVDEDMTLYSVYKKEEIHHDCSALHNNYYCKNKNILTRTRYADCTLALYKKSKEEIKSKCALVVSSPQEIIIQLNSTTFYTYLPNNTDLFVNCPEDKQQKRRLTGFNIITLEAGCRASLEKHVFTSGIEVEEEIVLKQNALNLHLGLTYQICDKNGENPYVALNILKKNLGPLLIG